MKVASGGDWPKKINASTLATTGSPRNATEIAVGRTCLRAQLKTVCPIIVGTTASAIKYAQEIAPYGPSELPAMRTQIKSNHEHAEYSGVTKPTRPTRAPAFRPTMK